MRGLFSLTRLFGGSTACRDNGIGDVDLCSILYHPGMPNYRRAIRPGGTFFFTLVTYGWAPFLCEPAAQRILGAAISGCREVIPFEIDAFVLLPDHLHAIWTLPEGDGDFSKRWGVIKKLFTQEWTAEGGWQGEVSESRTENRRHGGVATAVLGARHP
jgi:putative transposase